MDSWCIVESIQLLFCKIGVGEIKNMISKSLIEDILNMSLTQGNQFTELFIENKNTTSITLIDGKIETSNSGLSFGIGIRLCDGFKTIYGYTNDATYKNLFKLVKEMSATSESLKRNENIKLIKMNYMNGHTVLIRPADIRKSDKRALLVNAYEAAANYDKSILRVKIDYIDYEQDVIIANTDGVFVEDKRVRTRAVIESVAQEHGNIQSASIGLGAHMGYELYEKKNICECSREASRVAKTMLYAKDSPNGKMPVVINNGLGGVIFHEACGHTLEAHAILNGRSVFANRIGQKIASEKVTLIDDGTISNFLGSQNLDDEGTPMKRNVLIQNGILKGYMIDKFNGEKLGMKSTGSARRQSYKYAPTARMTNTFILNGNSSHDEIISNTEFGLYVKYVGGGSVNPYTGDFNFSVMEGYLIKDGKIGTPVKGATLIGKGAEVLKKVDMVANDLEFSQGWCNSISGMISVNLGQPTIRVEELGVGGGRTISNGY